MTLRTSTVVDTELIVTPANTANTQIRIEKNQNHETCENKFNCFQKNIINEQSQNE